MAIRIVIADDHSVVRRGLRMFLAMDPELVVVGEAADGEEAVHLAKQYVTACLYQSLEIGQGQGPVGHVAAL